jgi:uncharacterized membrane protein
LQPLANEVARSARRLCLESLEPRVLLATTRLGVVGDYSANIQTQAITDVANLVKGWNPDAIVTLGDNNYPSGEAATIDTNIGQFYHSYIYPYTGSYGAGSPTGANRFWPALGNHDLDTQLGKPYTNYFTLPNNERYYATQVGNVALFVIDSDPREPDGVSSTSTQAQYIKAQMLASTAQWKLVVLHHPPFSSGSHSSNADVQWPFREWGATAVLGGHDHSYERLAYDGLPYFVNGLGGESIDPFDVLKGSSQVRYNANYGAMQIDATDTDITFRFINRAGLTVDSYVVSSSTLNDLANYVSTTTTWKYLDNGTSPSSTWTSLGFDDSAWKSGAGQFGYGEGDETTVVSYGSNAASKYITTYFRKSFSVSDKTRVAALSLSLLRDDGAVIYLNGTEIYRSNMPSGTITSSTLATTDITAEDETAWYAVAVNPALLVNGTNVLSVEVHQNSAASSDLSFHAQLSARLNQAAPTTIPAAPTNFKAAVPGLNAVNLTWTDNASNEFGYRLERARDGSPFIALGTLGPDTTSFLDTINLVPGAKYLYRLRALNPLGLSTYANLATTILPLTQNLITAGSTWKYLDNGTTPSATWTTNSFVDTAWKSGAAQFGYGDDDETTVVSYGSNAASKYITTYFRKSFNVPAPETILGLTLNLLRDDGAVVYLNGVEVYRNNMPSGVVTSSTLALVNLNAPDESVWYSASVDPALLTAGANTLAVELHQATSSSTDISFDFSLISTVATGYAGPPADPGVSAPSALAAKPISASRIDLTWVDTSSNESGFTLERSSDGTNYAVIATLPPNTTSYSDTGRSASTKYWYRIRAYRTGGTFSFYSGPVSATTFASFTPMFSTSSISASQWRWLFDLLYSPKNVL